MSILEVMDGSALVWMNDWRHPALVAGMSIVTWLGSVIVLLPLALAIGWRMDGARQWRNRAFLLAAVFGAAVAAHALKWAIDRERPDLYPSLIAMPADASLPSAHAMQITAFVAAWLIATHNWRHPGQVIAGLTLVAAVAFSRLYLQVHFLSDILLGIVGGLIWVAMLSRLPFWRRA